jgi:N-acyl-D-amino-acid deacylase
MKSVAPASAQRISLLDSEKVGIPAGMYQRLSISPADVAMKMKHGLLVAGVLFAGYGGGIGSVRGQTYDLLIRGGQVLDGTGNPASHLDVGIREGKIVAVGRLSGIATRTIEARGKVVCPGFIDLHSHAERGLDSPDPRRRAAPNLVSQGITTVCVNPDGGGPWPLSAQRAAFERSGVGPNTALMIGHGTIRRLAMKEDFKRAANAGEIARMREMVRLGLADGAWGVSAGLEYVPGIWSTTEELIELVREIGPAGGAYIVHQRSESTDPRWYQPSVDPPGLPSMLDAIRETIRIGEETGATVVWSHAKVMGAHYWGSSAAAIRLIAQARVRGVNVWTDQYPYNSTGGDGAAVLVPAWAIGDDAFSSARGRPKGPNMDFGYADALRRTMSDPGLATRVHKDVAHEISRRGGAENIVVFDFPDRKLVGQSLEALAKARGLTPVAMALELQYQGFRDRPGGARLRGFSVWEDDVHAIMAQSWTATSTDAGIALPEDGPDVHARFYGSFPRKLHHYALERGIITLEQAIRSSTSLPAQILGLRDRGLIREGLAADIVVFDPKTVRDTATFSEPHRHAQGIEFVLVNGKPVVDATRLTGALAGRVLVPEKARR